MFFGADRLCGLSEGDGNVSYLLGYPFGGDGTRSGTFAFAGAAEGKGDQDRYRFRYDFLYPVQKAGKDRCA